MTYNVWFDAHNSYKRYETITEMILESNANVICLQECMTKFYKILFGDKRIIKKF
jgi:mRNA deadenylase 3'-5' endonuclease subunit Ccr4